MLCGNLAPEGAVVKKVGVDPVMLAYQGSGSVVFVEEDMDTAASDVNWNPVLVIRYLATKNLKSGPNMGEILRAAMLIDIRGCKNQ